MAHGSSPGAVRRLVDAEWSAGVPSADPDDPQVRGFAEFGLRPDSPLTTEDWLHRLQAWRDGLQIPANSVFLDGTLLMTVEALLDCEGRRRRGQGRWPRSQLDQDLASALQPPRVFPGSDE